MEQTIAAIKHLSSYWKILPELSSLALMDLHEKALLYAVANSLPPNSVMVEIGTFIGASASILSVANPQSVVYTVDSYGTLLDNDKHAIGIQEKLFGTGNKRSLENVKNLLKDYTNIIPIDAISPHGLPMQLSMLSPDLYFEDGSHSNPEFKNNVDFWLPKINKGGFAIFHDHRPWLSPDNPLNFPDIDARLKLLFEDSAWEFIAKANSLSVFKKIHGN